VARITVVDDYADFVEMMTSVLGDGAGHEVIGFGSSQASVVGLLESEPDLLILDLHSADAMGIRPSAVGDGSAAAAVLDVVPTIACSGDLPALRYWARACRDRSTVHMLEKPFTLAQLTQVVERTVSGPVHERRTGPDEQREFASR
jgi:DNA-binding NtrC family response regulator